MQKRILFVCLGNICRSPSAEAVMNGFIKREDLENEIQCDSAGILSYHAGEPADKRMQKHAVKRGYRLTSISRPVNPKVDFDHFDMIIGMDDQNIRDLKSLARNQKDLEKIFRMTDFCRENQFDAVPDPYYGGEQGFELVLDILEDACKGLLDYLKNGTIKAV
jgi:protein-tyrosine phosphatase